MPGQFGRYRASARRNDAACRGETEASRYPSASPRALSSASWAALASKAFLRLKSNAASWLGASAPANAHTTLSGSAHLHVGYSFATQYPQFTTALARYPVHGALWPMADFFRAYGLDQLLGFQLAQLPVDRAGTDPGPSFGLCSSVSRRSWWPWRGPRSASRPSTASLVRFMI